MAGNSSGAAPRGSETAARAAMDVAMGDESVAFEPRPAFEGWRGSAACFGEDSELALLLAQLEEEGFAEATERGYRLPWDSYYKLRDAPGHAGDLGLLRLPPEQGWRPVLSSKGTLTDSTFAVAIQGWIEPTGKRAGPEVSVVGAALSAEGRQSLLTEPAWRTTLAVKEQRSRKLEERSSDRNKRDWSTIRGCATRAGADLTDYLRKTVVVTPARLSVALRKGDNGLVEVIPGFDEAPSRWLEMFDRQPTVSERYEVPDGLGVTHVLFSPEVRTVLAEIRKMPGRRVAGERAEAFVRNPFAALGPDASKAIDPDQFQKARDEAGIAFSRFTAQALRDESGYPYDVSLLIERTLRGELSAEQIKFDGPTELEAFLRKLDGRIAAEAQCCAWAGVELEILGDTPSQAELLRRALDDWRHPGRIGAAEIFDLSRYSERVGGFGVEGTYYSPFIARKDDGQGWFGANVDLGVSFVPKGGSEPVAIVLDERNLAAFRKAVQDAIDDRRETFDFPGCPKPIPVDVGADVVATLSKVRKEVEGGAFDPKSKARGGTSAAERKGLVVKPNIDTLDYEERRELLVATGEPASLPKALRPTVSLKDHQLEGVAWLQHMWRNSPRACRGALLADDMGLGKTLQLLTFMAAVVESEPDAEPFLVVAPVSLLENWKQEIEKFFAPGALQVLTLYGHELAAKRQPKAALDAELVQAGSPKLLARGWRGSARVVLTTYETLRDLEFSLAAQRWSAMICDEAQKIKNPNALVTRAAKKQNARLKIACTGTPVENTLADLWCLFDFSQPGLLGSLKDFGARYRKPIETETEDEKQRIEELRELIAPQQLRRTKAEVAKDLPRKIVVEECRSLRLSPLQRSLYADAIGQFRTSERSRSATGLQSPLGLLQYLRKLCSDPRPPGQLATDAESIADVERHSPKMAWMLGQLKVIEAKGEKAIVFCEFRELQRTIARAIASRFGFTPDIVNGDTSTDSADAYNRQRRIEAFQAKSGFGAIVLSPIAVGFGVNIQAANHVIHFTRTWNPAKEDQATDRAYRIGQERDVYVYYPVVVADDFVTFDAKLDALLERKRALSDDMLNGAGDIDPKEFGDLQSPGGGNAFGDEPLGTEDIRSLDPQGFEAFCALLWTKMGFSRTIRTGGRGDGGVDIIAIDGARGALIQCKSSSAIGRQLGWEAVKDIHSGAPAYASRYPSITFALVAATNQGWNGPARSQAETLGVELVDGPSLERSLEAHPIKKSELQKFLLSRWS